MSYRYLYVRRETPAVRLIVATLLTCLLSEVAGTLRGVSKDDLDRMFSEYEIVHPTVVSPTGHFISHHLKHAEELSSFHQQRIQKRRRRSLDNVQSLVVSISESNARQINNGIDVSNDMFSDDNNQTFEDERGDVSTSHAHHSHWTTNTTASSPPTFVHLNIPAFGSQMRLRVESKRRLIAPGAKSVIFTNNGGRIERELQSNCMFSGKIYNRPKSRVAISNCDGLAGLIQTADDDYFIEPIEEQLNAATPQRHVIYKRSATTQSANVGKRLAREASHHHHQDTAARIHDSLEHSVETVLGEDEGFARKRKRHAKRNDYNMEVLLAADSEVVRFHGAEHVENYLLTLINIVDEIYHDGSLGEHINIVLSRLYQLDEARSDALIINENPPTSLKNVCKWAHDMARNDPAPHGRLHDHAIFLTRKEFGPAGYAHVTGMCHALRSCSLNHEDGFSSSFIVAHETGHVLGMEHDGEGNKCGDETSMGSIMAPVVQAAFHRYHWSRCSQQELKRHLRNFNCLLDDPHAPDWGLTPGYPGVSYSMDDQCRFDFGQGYRRCTGFRNLNVCKTLWCSHDDNPLFCKTKKGPPLDGTACGNNMWCFKSHCVWKNQRQSAVDGNWGSWSAYSECSRSCGTGVMFRSRQCDNPPPSHGGSNCIGQNVDYDLCNKRPCPHDRDFRADQCMYRNNEVEYKDQRHKWLPYEPLDPDLKCELYCVSKKTNDVVTMGAIVVDGTLCSYEDPHGICIRGECVEVGCDKVIGSSLREDDCGVCGGDGRKCRNIHGRLDERATRKINSYMRIYKIPKGSRHIRISEVASADNSNLLALKSRSTKRYFLNSKSRRIPENNTPTKFIHSGTMWTYDSRRGVETITASGPLNSDIILLILVRSRGVQVQAQYSYVLHVNNVSKPRDSYHWAIKRWSPCSVTCGNGIRRSKYGCKRNTGNKWVGKRNCPGRQPRAEKRHCSAECVISNRWVSGEWGNCSKTCGVDAFQERTVKCHKFSSDRKMQPVSDIRCLSDEKPTSRQTCLPGPCPPKWRVGPWSRCSITCGEGIRRRQVLCRSPRRMEALSEVTCSDARPVEVESCSEPPCEHDARTSLIASTPSALPSTGGETCEKDQSIFCKLKAHYCNLPTFRNLCCKSCKNFVAQDLVAGQPAVDRIISIAQIQNVSEHSNQSDIDSLIATANSETTDPSLVHPSLIPIIAEPMESEPYESDKPIKDVSVNEDTVMVAAGYQNHTGSSINQRNMDYVPSNNDSESAVNNVGDHKINNQDHEEAIDLSEIVIVDGTSPSDELIDDDGVPESEMIDEHIDQESNLPENNVANPPHNESPTFPSTIGLTPRGNPDVTDSLTASLNTSKHLRMRRSTQQVVARQKGWTACNVDTCGVGRRRAVFGCWDEVSLQWKRSALCSQQRIETVCVVPCYTRSKSMMKANQYVDLPRSSMECRHINKLGYRHRTKRHKCRGIWLTDNNLKMIKQPIALVYKGQSSEGKDVFDIVKNHAKDPEVS